YHSFLRGTAKLRLLQFVKCFLFEIIWLFACRVNVGCGPAEERLLLTGLHAVADIYCENCHTTLGWKYVRAPLIHVMFS
uniref:Yippee domain-containing protein n=1 Tax=Oryzias sinensis TaxID=183150 RepID=A0A8C7Y8R8_9TELE